MINDAVFVILSKLGFLLLHWLKTKYKWKYDATSLIHSIYTTIVSHTLIIQNRSIHGNADRLIHKYPNLIKYTGLFSLSYGFYDLFESILMNRPDFILHGALMVSFLSYMYIKNEFHKYIQFIAIEFSTIFLSLRNAHPDNIHINAIFFFTFALYRIVYLTYISIYQFMFHREKIVPNTIIIAVYILNLFWFIKMLSIIRRKLKKWGHI